MFDTTGLLTPQIDHSIRLIESLEANNIAHDASPMGTGKTFVSGAVMRHLKRKFVVISPKLNIPKWIKVLKSFGVKPELVINYEKLARGNMDKVYRYKKRGKTAAGHPISSLPYFLRGEFRIPKDWIVILDESHRAKGVDSLNAGLLYALTIQGFTVLCLSATQAMTPLDMRAFGFATGLHKGLHHTPGRGENYGMNLFKTFCENAGAEFTGQWGAMYFDSSKPESVAKLKAIRDVLFVEKKISSRMKREDFGDIFKHNQIEATSYDMGENGKKIAGVYHDMQRELAQLDDRTKNYQAHVLAIITKARRLAELLKVPSMVELTEDLFNEGRSVIIQVNYTDTIESLVARLGKIVGPDLIGQIHGGQTVNQRLRDIDDYQSDKKRIMVSNLAAGAECIDLHDITGKFPRAQLINPSYRAIAVVQASARADRAGALSDIWTNMVMCSGTIEDQVAQRFNDKSAAGEIINDGDLVPDGLRFRGIEGMNV